MSFETPKPNKVSLLLVLNFMYVIGHDKIPDMIYILSWTSTFPIDGIGMEARPFFDRKCPYQNCFITNDTSYFGNLQDFDAIIFNIVNLQDKSIINSLPYDKSENQVYILFSQVSPELYPLYKDYDYFFDATWTYKLDSSIPIPFIHILNKNERIIGPKTTFSWMEYKSMKPVSKQIKRKLKEKKVAAAWFASNCFTNNKRYEFVQQLQYELNQFEHRVDIYGECGYLQCQKYRMDECNALIQRDYYFYLAFESSFAEDYVTDQLLHAVQNYAVPVVYGTANYSRFLPPGSYLDARALGYQELAKKMVDIIKNPKKYTDYFKWHKYYSYQSTIENLYTQELCELCAFLNDVKDYKRRKVIRKVAKWWNGKDSKKKQSMIYELETPIAEISSEEGQDENIRGTDLFDFSTSIRI